jgi:hypothetical protein
MHMKTVIDQIQDRLETIASIVGGLENENEIDDTIRLLRHWGEEQEIELRRRRRYVDPFA